MNTNLRRVSKTKQIYKCAWPSELATGNPPATPRFYIIHNQQNVPPVSCNEHDLHGQPLIYTPASYCLRMNIRARYHIFVFTSTCVSVKSIHGKYSFPTLCGIYCAVRETQVSTLSLSIDRKAKPKFQNQVPKSCPDPSNFKSQHRKHQNYRRPCPNLHTPSCRFNPCTWYFTRSIPTTKCS